MGKVQSQSHKRRTPSNQRNMHDDRDGPSGRDSPNTDYVRSVGDQPPTSPTSQLGQAPDTADVPHQGDNTSGTGENPNMDAVHYPQTPTPLPAYYRNFTEYPNEYPGVMSSYGYPMYSSSLLYLVMNLPPPPPPSVTDQENEYD